MEKTQNTKRYVLYMVFAALTTVINLGSQMLMVLLLQGVSPLQTKIFGFEIYFIIKLGTGTILGFIAKFLLDKFVVFGEKHEDVKGTLKQIFIYGLLAVITTLIFWSFEMSFRLIFRSEAMDIVGGLIGLVIGYTLKFFMDRKFVFVEKESQPL